MINKEGEMKEENNSKEGKEEVEIVDGKRRIKLKKAK